MSRPPSVKFNSLTVCTSHCLAASSGYHLFCALNCEHIWQWHERKLIKAAVEQVLRCSPYPWAIQILPIAALEGGYRSRDIALPLLRVSSWHCGIQISFTSALIPFSVFTPCSQIKCLSPDFQMVTAQQNLKIGTLSTLLVLPVNHLWQLTLFFPTRYSPLCYTAFQVWALSCVYSLLLSHFFTYCVLKRTFSSSNSECFLGFSHNSSFSTPS